MLSDKTALITGASGGIGLEISKLLAADKCNLVLVARNVQKLDELSNELKDKYSINVITIPKDLSIPSAPKEIFDFISQKEITIDFLINNAGYGGVGAFHESDLDTELNMMQVNMNALMVLTKLFLPGMVQRKFGKIMNVASTAAFLPGPFMTIYYATKAFVLSFSEALSAELKRTGVTVTALCPGPTETGFQERSSVGKTKLLKFQKMHNAEYIAKKGYRAMMNGKRIEIPGVSNKLLLPLIRFSPRSSVLSVIRWLQQVRIK